MSPRQEPDHRVMTPHTPIQPAIDRHIRVDVPEIVGWVEKCAQLVRSTKLREMLQEDKVKDKQDTSIEDLVIALVDPLIED